MKFSINGKEYHDPIIVRYLEYKTKQKAIEIPDTDEDFKFMEKHPVILINLETNGQLALDREMLDNEELLIKTIKEKFLLKEDATDINSKKDSICKLFNMINEGRISLYAAMSFDYRDGEKQIDMMSNIVDGADGICDYNEYPEFWQYQLIWYNDIIQTLIDLFEEKTICEEI